LNGTNPILEDTDGDGHNDGWEVQNGYDPLDPNDPPPESRLPEFFWQIAISVTGAVAGGVVGIVFFLIKRRLKKKSA